MRAFPIILVLLMLPHLFLVVNGEVFPTGTHWYPEEVREGERFTIFTVIISDDGSAPDIVNAKYQGETIQMQAMEENIADLNWSVGVLFHSEITPEFNKNTTIEIEITLDNGSISSFSIEGPVIIEEKGEEDDTILGLPRIYCGLSVIFITFIVLLLTWSYFKGRNIQKQNVKMTGAIRISCSSCGAEVGPDDPRCGKCGADLDEEEHVCGKCGKLISSDDDECPKCGTRLRSVQKGSEEVKIKQKRDKEILVDPEKKVTCRQCGAVYLKEEKKCPECGKH